MSTGRNRFPHKALFLRPPFAPSVLRLQSHADTPGCDSARGACVSTSAKDKGEAYILFFLHENSRYLGGARRRETGRKCERIRRKGERTQFGANTAGRTRIHGRRSRYIHTHIYIYMYIYYIQKEFICNIYVYTYKILYTYIIYLSKGKVI